MWPYTDEESGWLNSAAAESKPGAVGGRFPIVTHDMVQAYIADGRRLRAEAVAAGLRAGVRFAARAVRAALGRRARPGAELTAQDEAAHRLITPLTSIRSSSEILRDNPDMPLDQRARFLEVIAQESDRLTQAIHEVLGRTGPARSAGS